MKSLYEILRLDSEAIPGWLERFQPDDAFDHVQFFSSRVVYYPGSGKDGHPVKVFGSTRAAHCFVYADYSVPIENLQAELNHPRYRFKGYTTFARIALTERDIAPYSWVKHIQSSEIKPSVYSFASVTPFGFLEILDRDPLFDEAHGARRLAVLFLGADGFAAYDALFCQANRNPPFAVEVVDHGFGGNYDWFGQGGLLEKLARRCGVFPPWLIVAETSRPWEGYDRMPGVDGDRGGMHNDFRFLCRRTSQTVTDT